MQTNTRQLVVIPLFNEADTVAEVLAELNHHYQGDVLIVDDGSTDHSLKMIAPSKRLSLISHSKNLGYGASLIDGFEFAERNGYDFVVTMDCDAQHEPKQVPELFLACQDVDVASGSRYLIEQPSNSKAPADRRRVNQIITKVVNEITDYEITDAFCGFKAYRVAALRKLNLTETGYAFPIQFWIQAACVGLSVIEVPVARIYRDVRRSFGATLDDPEVRLAYYQRVIEREVGECRQRYHTSCEQESNTV